MTFLSNYDLFYLGKKAEELGFVRDTLEKVTRLVDILEYFNTNSVLKNSLALKGGTAINLTMFNLPRLSVDLDMDYLINDNREAMLENREVINRTIDRFLTSQGYIKNLKTKNPHSLDSWVYDYIGSSGNRDHIKVEINYSLRSHVLPADDKPIIAQYFSGEYKIRTLAPVEIYASKINALLSRAAARDLYDTRNMIDTGLFKGSDEKMLRKCVIFYAAISAKEINKSFDTKALDTITKMKIKTDLLPVIKRRDDFELESAKKIVKEYIADLMVLNNEEKQFLDKFENGEYIPELLFEDMEIISRIKNHPMAMWKTQSRERK